ncbi:MAG: hypothetical protein ACYSTT_10300, partial [Planctomycetota bacterium]
TTIDHAASTELVPLDIKIPRPMFTTWYQQIDVSNLEKLSYKPRPPFMAPVGTKNVALGKPIFCTDDKPTIGSVEKVTDGRKEEHDNNLFELCPGLQSITIDLGNSYNISAVLFWHNSRGYRVYYDVVVQLADDRDFVTNVNTLFNNDIDNSAGFGIGEDMHYVETNEGKLIDAKGVKARYVRLYSNGNTINDFNHYFEVEVYGKPAE